MKHRYRAAIVGCGRIGSDCGHTATGSSRLISHAAAYQSSPAAELVALCDVDEGRLARAGARYRVPRLYRDYRELLDRERPDLVSICTPAQDHARVLSEVLEHGAARGVLLEKPLATSMDAALDAVARVKRSRAVVAVNYTRRFVPAYQGLVSQVRSGGLGRIQHVSGLYGKGIFNNGTHLLDLVRWMFGEPSSLTVAAVRAPGDDPTLDLHLEWPDGIVMSLHGTDAAAYNVFELDIVGTAGRVRVTDLGHRLERHAVDDTSAAFGFRQLAADAAVEMTRLDRAIPAAIDNLIDCVESGARPCCTVEDGEAVLRLAWQAAGQVAGLAASRSCS